MAVGVRIGVGVGVGRALAPSSHSLLYVTKSVAPVTGSIVIWAGPAITTCLIGSRVEEPGAAFGSITLAVRTSTVPVFVVTVTTPRCAPPCWVKFQIRRKCSPGTVMIRGELAMIALLNSPPNATAMGQTKQSAMKYGIERFFMFQPSVPGCFPATEFHLCLSLIIQSDVACHLSLPLHCWGVTQQVSAARLGRLAIKSIEVQFRLTVASGSIRENVAPKQHAPIFLTR